MYCRGEAPISKRNAQQVIARGRAAAIFHCSPLCGERLRVGATGAAVGMRGAHVAAAMFACTVVKQHKVQANTKGAPL